jgi:hypothetical protein
MREKAGFALSLCVKITLYKLCKHFPSRKRLFVTDFMQVHNRTCNKTLNSSYLKPRRYNRFNVFLSLPQNLPETEVQISREQSDMFSLISVAGLTSIEHDLLLRELFDSAVSVVT